MYRAVHYLNEISIKSHLNKNRRERNEEDKSFSCYLCNQYVCGGCQSDPKKQIIGTWEFDEGFTITFMDDGTFG